MSYHQAFIIVGSSSGLVVMLQISVSLFVRTFQGRLSHISSARTFPVSGKFTTAQAELYSAVLTVQRELITDCTEAGGYTLHELHRKSCSRLREELTKLGFNFESKNDSDLERVLYPHFLSHPIGIGEFLVNTFG